MFWQEWGFWSVLVSWVGAAVALIAMIRANRSAQKANDVQAELLQIERARRTEEVRSMQHAQIDAVALLTSAGYELQIRSIGPGTAFDVRLEVNQQEFHWAESGKEMPRGTLRRVATVPSDWKATQTIDQYVIKWRHPSGEPAETTFQITEVG